MYNYFKISLKNLNRQDSLKKFIIGVFIFFSTFPAFVFADVFILDLYKPNIPLQADVKSFKKLDYTFAKDKNHVFCQSLGAPYEILPDANVETFEILRSKKDVAQVSFNGFARDKNNFFCGCKKISNVDVATLEILDEFYIKDKNHVWFEGDLIDSADAKTFNVISDSTARDKDHIYYLGHTDNRFDSETFSVISGSFLRDKQHVYFVSRRITPEPYDKNSCGWGAGRYITGIQIVENADPATFKLLYKEGCEGQAMAKDKNHLYRIRRDSDKDTFFEKIDLSSSGIDLDTFKFKRCYMRGGQGFQYLEDKNAVYSFNKNSSSSAEPISASILFKIVSTDLKNFVLMEDIRYAKDSNQVYYKGEIIEGADPHTFTPAPAYGGRGLISAPVSHDDPNGSLITNSSIYMKDKKHVYAWGNILHEADPFTFIESPHTGYSKDEKHFFYDHNLDYNGHPRPESFDAIEIQDIDSASFEVLEHGYAKDKNNVFYKGNIINNADTETFKVVPCATGDFAKDKQYFYAGKNVLEGGEFEFNKRTTYCYHVIY